MSSRPVKKVGSEKPTKASVLAIWSKSNRAASPARCRPAGRSTSARICEEPIDEQRGRHALQDQRVDVDAAGEGEAPVALRHGGEPAQVAQPDRVVEAELGAQDAAHLGRDVRVGREFLERVARRQRQHREQDEADAEQARDRDQQPPEEVVPHRRGYRAGGHVSGRHASRYQSARSQVSLSQPLSGRHRACWRAAATRVRETSGMTTWLSQKMSFILMKSAARLTGSSSFWPRRVGFVVLLALPARDVAALPLVRLGRDLPGARTGS